MSTKLIFYSNLSFIICSLSYLSWWLLAFKPVGAIKGIRSAWLLLPAFMAGAIAIYLGIKAIRISAAGKLSNYFFLLGGLLLYFLLSFITTHFFQRPLTTELFLIVAWLTLILAEINQFYAESLFSASSRLLLLIFVCSCALISLFCYLQYYHLGIWAGYLVGMVPLLLVLLVAVVMNLLIRYN